MATAVEEAAMVTIGTGVAVVAVGVAIVVSLENARRYRQQSSYSWTFRLSPFGGSTKPRPKPQTTTSSGTETSTGGAPEPKPDPKKKPGGGNPPPPPPPEGDSSESIMKVHLTEKHLSVEVITDKTGSLTTERVVKDDNAPDSVSFPSEYNGYNSVVRPTKPNPKSQTYVRKIPSGGSAQVEQGRQVLEGGTPYFYRKNSCCTHLGDVGNAGGIPFPNRMRMKDVRKELNRQGFTREK